MSLICGVTVLYLIPWVSAQLKLAEKAIKITPYNSLGYGALVAVLLAVIYFLWKDRNDIIDRNNEILERHQDYVDRVVGLVQLVESKLNRIEQMQNTVEEVRHEVEEIRRTQDQTDA